MQQQFNKKYKIKQTKKRSMGTRTTTQRTHCYDDAYIPGSGGPLIHISSVFLI